MLPLLLWYHRNPALSRTLSLQPSLVWPFTGLPLPLGLEGSGWELEVWGIDVLFSPSGCFQTTSPPFLHPSSQCQTIFSATVQPFMDSWVLPTQLPFLKKKKNFYLHVHCHSLKQLLISVSKWASNNQASCFLDLHFSNNHAISP